jgi:hypothetical protein
MDLSCGSSPLWPESERSAPLVNGGITKYYAAWLYTYEMGEFSLCLAGLQAPTSSGLPALYILDEMLSRLAFDLKSRQGLLPWQYFEMTIGTGSGGCVYPRSR